MSNNLDNDNQDSKLGRTPPTLSYFCVYNPSLGPSEENTKDQILYYTAKKVVPSDIKMKHVGLAQALVNFTATFSPSRPAQNVHSQKNRMIFLQPEPGFWIHMCIELGTIKKSLKTSRDKTKLSIEYLESELNDLALESLLELGYEQFKLLNGTFSSILYGNKTEPTRQRTRNLMDAIEEFFSDWIWKWDLDRLDKLCFDAVFNGVPTQPIVRLDYLKIHELEQSMKLKIRALNHMAVFHQNDLVYRSPEISIRDICSLRKFVLKQIKPKEIKSTMSQKPIGFLNYFSKTKVESVKPEREGLFLTGLVETKVIGMTGEERVLNKSELVKVFLESSYVDQNKSFNSILPYYLVLYQDKSNLVWSFLFEVSNKIESLLSNIKFYQDLENELNENNLDDLIKVIQNNINNVEEKTLNLGKNYQCFYYDNTTLNLKSTVKTKEINNEILLELLELKKDFQTISLNEVYTRSTNNYWIAGNRLYHLDKENDYTEIYLIAFKKDTSLSNVEETLIKMKNCLLETMYIE